MQSVKYYYSSIAVSVLALIFAFFYGGLPAMFMVAILSVLETSLSFDNAVVNAKILENWSEKWRNRFIVWGIPIAVFGMRFVFPLAIVGVALGSNPIAAFQLAISQPEEYAKLLSSVHYEISAFGGVFLMMVFLKFFMNKEKEEHWLGPIEWLIAKFDQEEFNVLFTLTGLVAATLFLPTAEDQINFMLSGLGGLATYILVHWLGTAVGGDEAGDKLVREGWGGFMYLEVLDASFSFDGVIGAFAITNNIFIITLGLGVGAMFVRSMTIHLVAEGTLSKFKYLEHGAFWGIGALAFIMIAAPVLHVPEIVTGLIGAGAIGLSIISSMRVKHV